MFDRCDPDTRAIIDAALDEAGRRGQPYLGTEHLLLALSRRRELLPDDVAAQLPAPEAISSALAAEVGEPAHPDTELLKTVGIDLNQVRLAVRRTFGDDAVERLGRRRVHQPWQPWRRPSRRCTSLLAGTVTVSRRAKEALDRAGTAAGRTQQLISPVALLGGMLDVDDALSNRLLNRLGVDPFDLRARTVRIDR